VISVAYHLVRPQDRSWLSGIPAMSPEELDTQLAVLTARYRMLEPSELLELVRVGQPVPGDACVLTFDDGYVGQYEHALPILRRLGLRAFFFVPTGVLEEGECPTVEKQRVLQYALWPYEEFYSRFSATVRDMFPLIDPSTYMASKENLAASSDYYGEYSFYSQLERLFRKVRERSLTGEQFDTVIGAMFASEFDEHDFVKRYFLGWGQVEDLTRLGMEIGGHGHAHLTDTAVDPPIAAADAVRSLDILRRRLGRSIESYCYPYGIFRPETVSAIKAAGVMVAFTCRHGEGDAGSPLLLDRIDCRSFR
jgi:peptidoglycan/xylan/chitin deacetylase (PgdA/CDA1 family)